MDPFDDYQDEVERLTQDEIEAILSGEGHSSRSLTTLIRDIRLDLLENPSPDIATQHLSDMARAARPRDRRPAAPPKQLGRRSVLPKRRLAVMGLAAALLLVAGLAAAVTLPKKAAQPAEDILPSTAPSVTPAAEDLPQEAAHGQAVADVATDPSLTGCEKGQAVADVASAKAAEKSKHRAEKNDPCGRTGRQGKPNSEGRDKAPAAPGVESRGRSDSHPAGGAGSVTAPGVGHRGRGGGGAEASGGQKIGGGGGLGGSKVGGGGVPKDLPKP